MRSGPSPIDAQGVGSPVARDGLVDRVDHGHDVTKVVAIAAQVRKAADQPAVHALFREGAAALGAECAAFVSFVRDDAALSSCRFMIDCDPAWGRMYLEEQHFAHDPWLAYASHHSEPILASTLQVTDAAQHQVIALAVRAGFASAVLVPAHSGAGHARISLLCLGSAEPGYFDNPGLPTLRITARMLAMELHEWWVARLRRNLVIKARLSHEDLILLQHQVQGHSSKKIANDWQVSKSSINSRFQRLNVKLGVPNRRMAAKLAIECGLILK